VLVCSCCADTGVCALFGWICSHRRVCVCAVCRDTCMRARSILSWREALHNTHSRRCTPHTQAHYPRTLLPSIHSRCISTHAGDRGRSWHPCRLAYLERGTPLIPACLARCFSLTTASRPKPWHICCIRFSHQTPQRVSSISADLACAISLRAEICDDLLIHHSRPSHIVLNQAPSTEGEPGGTNRSPPATARVCLRGAAGPVPPVVSYSDFHASGSTPLHAFTTWPPLHDVSCLSRSACLWPHSGTRS
jgi:hypothetical protein